MAVSSSFVGWSRESFWRQSSAYSHYHRGSHLPSAAPPVPAVPPSTAREPPETSSSDTGEGGDYALRAHELIVSPNSPYEVLETLGERAIIVARWLCGWCACVTVV